MSRVSCFSVWAHNAYNTLVKGQKNTYDITISYKTGWTKAQKIAAKAKVQALNKAKGKIVIHNPTRSGTAQSSYRRSNKLGSNIDADHTIDLQVGGKDALSNISGLDKSVNRSIGRHIQQAISNITYGTRIRRVTIS